MASREIPPNFIWSQALYSPIRQPKLRYDGLKCAPDAGKEKLRIDPTIKILLKK